MEKIRHIKVKRIKDEVIEEPKMRHVKVKRIKNELVSPEDIIHVRVIRFKKEYEKFLELTGVAPDEFVEKTVNKIAELYFKYKYGYNPKLVKKELKETKYLEFMEVFMNIDFHKMKLMNISHKMINGAGILYNLINRLISDSDKKIPLYCDMYSFYCEYTTKKNTLLGIDNKVEYGVEFNLKRMFAIKDKVVIAYGKEAIDNCDNLKGSIIYTECSYRKLFMAIPYRYYKKLCSINNIAVEGYIMHDPGHEHEYDEFENYEKAIEVTENDYCDSSFYYYNSREAYDFDSILRLIFYYEQFGDFISEFDSITAEGYSINSLKVSLKLKDGTFKEMTYDKFISEYMYFLRL